MYTTRLNRLFTKTDYLIDHDKFCVHSVRDFFTHIEIHDNTVFFNWINV